MEMILGIVTTMCVGLMVGVELAMSAFVNPILEKLEDSARAEATRRFAGRLGRAMPFWYVASFLLIVVEAVVVRGRAGFVYVVVAGGLWVAVIVLTLMSLVPINNRLIKMGEFTQELQREQGRWDMLHRWRVLVLGVAMACLLVGIRL